MKKDMLLLFRTFFPQRRLAVNSPLRHTTISIYICRKKYGKIITVCIKEINERNGEGRPKLGVEKVFPDT